MIYNINNVIGRYHVRFDESKYSDWRNFYKDIDKLENRLKSGIFKDKEGKMYKAEWKRINLSVIYQDLRTNTLFTSYRIYKYIWEYQQIK